MHRIILCRSDLFFQTFFLLLVFTQVLSEKHTIRFVFHDFEKLPHEGEEEEDATTSSVVLCHGYKWKLGLFPGGDDQSDEDEVYLSLYLQRVSAESDDCEVRTKFAIRLPSANGCTAMGEHFFCRTLDAMGSKRFHLRSDVLDPTKGFLVDGNLIIEVDIQVYKKDVSPFWEPKNELQIDLMKVLESADQSSDVTFLVGPEEFSANLNILKVRAPELAALAEDCPSGTPIPMKDIKPSAFRSLLRFVYANDVDDHPNEARDLLDVANRFGCKGLKLAAEAELAASGISVDTAADMILLGDAKNCALLKEAAMDFFAANATSVMSSPGWEKVEESLPLMKELMEVVVNTNKKRSAPVASDEDRDCKRMCVSALRRRLEDKGLEVDGSRDTIIRRLEEEEIKQQENDDDSNNSGSSSNEDN
jgi:hypothetical protein